MARIAFRLIPARGGGFHLGREGLDQETSAETFPSDSLLAALLATLRELVEADEVDDFLRRWPRLIQSDDGWMLDAPDGLPPFRLSSLFPFAGDVPLYPVPRLRIQMQGEAGAGTAKRLKKLAYVSPGVLQRLLTGQAMDRWLPSAGRPSEGVLLQGGKVWLAQDEIRALPARWQTLNAVQLQAVTIWGAQPVPRVTIDRTSNSSQIFHVGRTVFAEDCGLWLLADVEHEGDLDLLEALLEHLGDRGIGGERSAGYGKFTGVRWPQATRLDLPGRAQRMMTLSRYSPTRDELAAGVLGEQASYELVDVGGWLATPEGPAQRRKRVRLIEAGSILVAEQPPVGQLVDVRPDYPGAPQGEVPHPVYRSGIALTIGVTGGD